MALLLGSCKDSVEEPGFDDAYARVPQSVVMQLNVALSAPTRDVPDCEKVKELRVILLDEKTKNVELNELMDVENYSVPEDSRFLYEYKKEGIMTTVGKKILYALANSEELIQDDNRAGQLEADQRHRKLPVPQTWQGSYRFAQGAHHAFGG